MANPSAASLPYARSFDEIYLYLDLRPCGCGETQLGAQTSTSGRVNGMKTERIEGACLGCGRQREFTFQMPDETPALSLDLRFGPDDEPSQLLDPGEWLGVAELYQTSVTADLDGPGDTDDDAVTRAYLRLTAALAAYDEVLKFVPDGADAVSEGAFRSPAGRLVYETAPDRLTRSWLVEARSALRQRIADFDAESGE